MNKQNIQTIHEKNKVIDNIIETIKNRNCFLILGHKNPDEDCIASMVAFALIVSKFSKKACVYISENVHEHFQYLVNICNYNSISCTASTDSFSSQVDTIVICDTPKPAMIDADLQTLSLMNNPEIVKIEIDHHIGADSMYIGDQGYRMVTEANSSSELVGLIILKLCNRTDILREYNINNLLSRNIILSVLTGIIGDTNMGQFIKTKRQKRYYDIFSNLYNQMLARETTKITNFTSKDEVFHEIQRLSAGEEKCFRYVLDRKKMSGSIGYVILDTKDMDYLTSEFDTDTIVSVTRSMADHLAEESTRLGLVVYDDSNLSNLVQFRLRRGHNFKSFDLRIVLDLFSIEDGGGHEGAIGFRIAKSKITDIEDFVLKLVAGLEKAMPL